LARELRRAAIENARRRTLEQKFRAGAELFDDACEITKAGIRMQRPDFTEDQVMDRANAYDRGPEHHLERWCSKRPYAFALS